MTKSRSFAALAAAAGMGLALLGASGAAQARDVYWSVGVNSPGVSVGVGAGPGVVYAPPPTFVVPPPPPVYYTPPAPVYYGPPPVAYVPPRPVYYAPPPAVYGGYGYYNRPPHWHRGGYWR
jgi:hypothetical protein